MKMANMMSLSDVYTHVRLDANATASALDGYSPHFRSVIRNNWPHVRNSLIIGSRLICTEFQFRLAYGRISPAQIDFWPSNLGASNLLISYTKSVIKHFYVRRRISIYVNFSPSFVLSTRGNSFFLYSSRSNFGCLDTAYLIHNNRTFAHFCDTILPNFSLYNYTMEQLSHINRKYPDGLLLPASLTFHVTKSLAKIYGSRASYGNRGISQDCCAPNDRIGVTKSVDCIWRALSTVVDISKNGKVVMRKMTRKGRINARVSSKLKRCFLTWHRSQQLGAISQPMTKYGFVSSSMHVLERFLQVNIVVYSVRRKNRMKIRGASVVSARGSVKCFTCEYVGQSDYADTINLLSDGDRHIIGCITDVDTYCAKFNCIKCCSSFPNPRVLATHEQNQSCQKNRKFRGESHVSMEMTTNTMLNLYLPDHSNTTFDHSFVLVTLRHVPPRGIMTKVQWCLGKRVHGVEEVFDNISDISTYLISFVPGYCQEILAKRVHSHASLLEGLEHALRVAESRLAGVNFLQDERQIRFNNLMRLKGALMKYWSKFVCYVQASCDDFCLAEELMHSLLSSLCTGSAKIVVRNSQGKLFLIEKDRFPVQFKWLSLLSPSMIKPYSELPNVKYLRQLIRRFKNDFKINFLEIDTVSEIGRKMMSSSLSLRNQLTLISPCRDLHDFIEHGTKFGVLGAKSTIVHNDSDFKVAYCLDVSKYYTFLLKNTPVYTGRSVRYDASQNGLFLCAANRRRGTFANILMILLDHVLEADIFSQIHGAERRVGLPIDGLMYGTNKTYIISYDGCLYHCSCLSKPCHRSHIGATHIKGCRTCKNDLKRHPLKPRLYKMKENETMNSAHPVQKRCTFGEVRDRSERNLEQVRAAADERVQFVVITECDVIDYFFSPLSEFAEKMGLPLKSSFLNIPLYIALDNITQSTFPLLQKINKGLRQDGVLAAILHDELNGFVVVTCEIGEQGQEQLSVFPFSFKDREGRSRDSYSIVKQIITTDYLRFLMKKIKDFKISKIHQIYEFVKPQQNMFEQMSSNAEQIMSKHCNDDGYVQLIKGAINGFVGSLNKQNSKYNRTIVDKCEKMMSVSQLKNLVKSTPVNQEYSMFYFKNNAIESNMGHCNYQLILKGKELMLDFMLTLKSFLAVHIQRQNTDGMIVCATLSPSHNTLTDKNPSCICFDELLRPGLSDFELEAYFEFKKSHFILLGVCPSHESSYLSALKSKTIFQQPCCCKTFKNIPSSYIMKLEGIHNHGLIVSANKLALFNTINNTFVIKCSGAFDERLQRSRNCNYLQLQSLCSELL